MADEFTEQDLDTPTASDLDECYGSKFLSAADLGDKKIRTRIAKIRKETMRQQSGTERPKFVVYFTTLDKPMVLNATNKIALVARLGNVPANWIGADVGLYTENTQFAGKPVKGLRLRVLGPVAAKPAPQPAKPAAAASWPGDNGDPGFEPDDVADFGQQAAE